MAARARPSEARGFRKLTRGIVRRDRLRLGLWLVAVPAVTLPSLAAYGSVFETEQSAQARAALMATPTGTVFGGPGYGLDNYTAGAMVANELLLFLDITVALAALLLVTHMTRREEETGRLELVGAAPVGRRAGLAAAVAVTAAEVTGIGLALGFGAMLYPELDPTDCLALGLAIAATGLAFTGLGALAAQVSGTGRGAAGLGAAVLGGAFLARAVGDTAAARGDSAWASWLSPLGWPNQTRVFVDLRWWPILLSLAFALVTGAAAAFLAARRDHGAGLVAPRAGPARASAALAGPLGLVWRRTRVSLLGWTAGAVTLALCMGPVLGSLSDYLTDNPVMSEWLGLDPAAGASAVIEGFTALIILYLAMLLAASAISAVGAFPGDERQGFAARQLAEPVARERLLGATLGGATASTLVGFGLAAGAYVLVVALNPTVSPGLAADVAAASLRALPGLVATVALAGFLVAAFPRLAALSWAPFAYAFAHVILGPALKLPDWTRYLSPLSAVPYSPATAPDWPALATLLVAAAALAFAAFRRFRTRDLLN
ncbi:MAG: hypothetical protein LBD51_04270 [Bifidobacteriaceae bacterium]|jgi:ABC-2 type transport system permease protein|nr:hypothetical protein [Bifidobacteriaceae bacterium]